ncbi:DEAD/DEAH box helicase [Alphaproteobacteria bacterium HT1-32]|nr:DEAD/DEAH box helicase [Alphaproteobacteria bacterium HT1-32]
MTGFSGLNLAEPILRALNTEGYTDPTPIQAKAIPGLLDGRDLLGVAQTGTGKTAAFALPLLHRLSDLDKRANRNEPQAIILAPTRELAGQIGDSIRSYGRHLRLRSSVVFGGVSIRPQIKALAQGVHILVATPGRLMDLVRQGHVRFSSVEVFILDEADRMLDMGFIGDVQKIAAAIPGGHQTVLFSATMPKAVQGLADSLLKNPLRAEVAREATTAARIEQKVLYVTKDNKRALLNKLIEDEGINRVLIFTRTKHGADRVARNLQDAGIESDAIHGNKAQNARQRALNGFRNGKIRALVATDIAARGIDVDGVTHVINFELPNDPESYVHRIGRTARAGADGIAISFCDHEERAYLQDIERTIRQTINVDIDHAYHAPEIANDRSPAKRPPQGGKRFQGNRPKRNGGGGGGGRPRNNNAPRQSRRTGKAA